MFSCPKCMIPMDTVRSQSGVFWRCPSCMGRSATIAFLRKSVPDSAVNEVWQAARFGDFPSGRVCPACTNRMVEVPANGQKLNIDVCTRCQFVWFDAGERELLPALHREPAWEETLPPEARERLAAIKVESMQAELESQNMADAHPDVWWQWVPGLFGLPVEQGADVCRSRPWATWTICLIILAVWVGSFGDLSSVVEQFGFIPAQAFRLGGLTFLSSFFLHGGVVHLLGNLYFLLVFGDNVEGLLGWKRFLILIIGASLFGDFAHIIANPSSDIPCIGASGGISGVLAFYALKFPNVKLKMLFRYMFYLRWFSVSARTAFFVWIGLQILGAWAQISGISNVSAMAHLGGVGFGFACWILFRDDNGFRKPEKAEYEYNRDASRYK